MGFSWTREHPNSSIEGFLVVTTLLLEWFSVECRKTKTKVITLANHKEHTQYSEPIKTRSNYR